MMIRIIHCIGLEFSLNSDEISYYVVGIGNCTDTNIIIPSEYEGLPVTAIEHDAFVWCESIVSVTIPNSVISIGNAVFAGCVNLASITFEGSKEQWNNIKIGDYWNDSIPATEVICSDGIVTLS